MKISCPKCGKNYDLPGTAIEQMLETHVVCDCGHRWLFPEEHPRLKNIYVLYLTFKNSEGSVVPPHFFENKFSISSEAAEKLIRKLQQYGVLTPESPRLVILRSPLFYELLAAVDHEEPSSLLQREKQIVSGQTRRSFLRYIFFAIQVLFVLWLLCGAPFPEQLDKAMTAENKISVLQSNLYLAVRERSGLQGLELSPEIQKTSFEAPYFYFLMRGIFPADPGDVLLLKGSFSAGKISGTYKALGDPFNGHILECCVSIEAKKSF